METEHRTTTSSSEGSVQLGSEMQNELQCKHLQWRLHLGDLPLNHDNDVVLYAVLWPLDAENPRNPQQAEITCVGTRLRGKYEGCGRPDYLDQALK